MNYFPHNLKQKKNIGLNYVLKNNLNAGAPNIGRAALAKCSPFHYLGQPKCCIYICNVEVICIVIAYCNICMQTFNTMTQHIAEV